METKEKPMIFNHGDMYAAMEMDRTLSKELEDGWKVKPGTFYGLGSHRSVVVLYREVPEKINPYP